MRYFQILGTFDPVPLLHEVQRHPELWNQNTLRTQHSMTAHAEVDDIWIRFNDVAQYKETGDASSIIDEHESIWYPAVDSLPSVRTVIRQLMDRVNGVRLGRVLITKLAPGKQILPHVDGGSHAAYYERYHAVLQGLPGSLFNCGDETVCMQSGSVWWFQNAVEHSVVNNSADDRIHVVIDIRQ